MKIILIGLCALSSVVASTPKTVAQAVTIELSPATNDSYWVWNDEFQCWIWNGPEFQGDYQGHPYGYWHGRHGGGGDRNNRPVKGDAEQSKVEQPRTGVEKTKAELPKVEERPKVEVKGKVEKSKTEEKPKAEAKSKTGPPKSETKRTTRYGATFIALYVEPATSVVILGLGCPRASLCLKYP